MFLQISQSITVKTTNRKATIVRHNEVKILSNTEKLAETKKKKLIPVVLQGYYYTRLLLKKCKKTLTCGKNGDNTICATNFAPPKNPSIRTWNYTARPIVSFCKIFFPIIITEASASYHRSLFQKVYELRRGEGSWKCFRQSSKKKSIRSVKKEKNNQTLMRINKNFSYFLWNGGRGDFSSRLYEQPSYNIIRTSLDKVQVHQKKKIDFSVS